jgi:DNA-binding LacI/PurR family transcriptional regulator
MSTPLYEQLYNHILDHIRSGKLTQGDRVPSEAELAAQFGVSRITSKKALEMLEQQGLIERIRGKGSFVSGDNPAVQAAALRSEAPVHSGSGLIGAIVPDFSDAYALKMIHAIEEACAEQGMFLAIKRTYGSQDVEKSAIQGMVALGAAGLIVFPVHGEFYNPELLRLVVGGYPVVLVDRHLSGIPASAVYTDNVSASRQLAAHVIAQGARHIAFISPPAEHTSTIEERIAGYRAALAEAGIPYRQEYMLTTLYSTLPTAFQPAHIRQDSETLDRFLDAHPSIEAFVASEYNLALLTREVLRRRGLNLPIVCFDSPESPVLPPSFTHIRQNEGRIGQRAVHLLLRQIAGERAARTEIVDFEFVQAE